MPSCAHDPRSLIPTLFVLDSVCDNGKTYDLEVLVRMTPAEVRYSVYRDDPDDPEGNGCINKRAVGRAGYPTLEAAIERADHATQGEYARTWITITGSDDPEVEVYAARGAIL